MKHLTLIRSPADTPGEPVEEASQTAHPAPPDYSFLTSAVRFDPYLLEDTTFTLEEVRRARASHPSAAPSPELELRSVS